MGTFTSQAARCTSVAPWRSTPGQSTAREFCAARSSPSEGAASTASKPRAAEVGERLVEAGVKYVFGAYVDAHGVPKSKCVPVEYLESMASGSELYTVGALEGMGELGPNKDECEGHPELGTVRVLPWAPRFAVAPADLTLHGEPYSHDSRHVLKRQLALAAELGYTFNVG